METTEDILIEMCEKYHTAVNANDSSVYKKLFAADAIRIPPGSEPEYGPEEIARGEQRDYDDAKWTIVSTPIDSLRISEDWIYGVASVNINTISHNDGSSKSFQATKTWLLQRQSSDNWLIKRQMWNLK